MRLLNNDRLERNNYEHIHCFFNFRRCYCWCCCFWYCCCCCFHNFCCCCCYYYFVLRWLARAVGRTLKSTNYLTTSTTAASKEMEAVKLSFVWQSGFTNCFQIWTGNSTDSHWQSRLTCSYSYYNDWSYTSSDNQLLLLFQSDWDTTDTGFRAIWSTGEQTGNDEVFIVNTL